MFNNNQWLQFALPGPRLHQGREQDATKRQPSATSSRRDVQQHGAMGAPHDIRCRAIKRIAER
jgi:hypothetical protein